MPQSPHKDLGLQNVFANKSKGKMTIPQVKTHFKAAWEPNDSNMDFANLTRASNSYAHIIFVHES